MPASRTGSVALACIAAIAGVTAAPDAWSQLRINEIVAVNSSLLQDEAGDFDDWVEIWNGNASPVDLAGYQVTDGTALPWTIPSGYAQTVIPAGGYLILWFDGEPLQGPRHVDARLSSSGEQVILYAPDGTTVVDSHTFGQQYEDVALIRDPNGTGDFVLSTTATPGAMNLLSPVSLGCTDPLAQNYNPAANVDDGSCQYGTSTVELYINEYLASNVTGIQDEAGQFEDWLEIYNPGASPVSMSGLYATDDLLNPQKWAFPDVSIPAGGFLLVWCDQDALDGPLHANFRLAAAGEQIGLFDATSAAIDTRVFGAQTPDVSEGREQDGAPDWTTFTTPTPGASNEVSPVVIAATELAYDHQAVTVAWRTSLEAMHAGFLVERRLEPDGAPVQITDALVREPESDGWYRVVDPGVTAGRTYRYTLIAIDLAGGEERLDLGTLALPLAPASRVQLHPATPNPFNPATLLWLDLPAAAHARLTIADAGGHQVRTLVDGTLAAGRHGIRWAGDTDEGVALPSGVYFARLEAAGSVETRKLVLAR